MAVVGGAGDEAAAWRRVLRLLLRRFGGRLLVRGRLLNPRELLVLLLRRVDATGATLAGDDVVVRVPELLALRVSVRGADESLERVGRDDVVALVLSRDGDVEVEADVLPAATSAALAWEDAQLLAAPDSKTLFGFDVRALLELSAAARLPDESVAAANAVLASAPAFSDLRSTWLLMRQSCGAEWLETHHTLQSFAMETRPLVASEAHPRSYVSLGTAQKRRWADERFDYGKELVAKRRLKDAVMEFTSCLKLDEVHAAALFARGEAHAALQQFADAISDFEAVRDLDCTFAGLDDALLRARGKQRHSRRVDLPSSALPTAEVSASSSALGRSPARQADLERDDSKQQPRPSSLSGASGDHRKKLESERLRRLLEAEVGEKREKRERHRRHQDSDSSDSDARRHRKRRAKKKSKASSKKRKRRRGDGGSDDSDDEQDLRRSSRKRKGRKSHKRSSSRRRSRSNSRPRYPNSSSSSGSGDDSFDASKGSVDPHRRENDSERRRKRDQRRRSSERPERRSASPAAKAEPHPILTRQRHRIWN